MTNMKQTDVAGLQCSVIMLTKPHPVTDNNSLTKDSAHMPLYSLSATFQQMQHKKMKCPVLGLSYGSKGATLVCFSSTIYESRSSSFEGVFSCVSVKIGHLSRLKSEQRLQQTADVDRMHDEDVWPYRIPKAKDSPGQTCLS